MVVLVIEHVSPSLRGELTRWLLEPRAGLFVGKVSGMVRERLWDYVVRKAPDCGIIMLYSAKCEQGFAMRGHGDTTRRAVDFEGLTLIQRDDPRLKRRKHV